MDIVKSVVFETIDIRLTLASNLALISILCDSIFVYLLTSYTIYICSLVLYTGLYNS